MGKPTTTRPSFTCKKCKRTLLGRPNMRATAPKSDGFKDVNLCVRCYWETVAFWNGQGDYLLRFLRNEEERLRNQHGIDQHADACRVQTERIEDYIKE